MIDFRHYLEFELGIHHEVIDFLCDRPVPENNEYWKGRESYLSRSPGYLFIPILFDLFLKSGIPKSEILSEFHVRLIEDVLHLAARQERDHITYPQLHEACRQVVQSAGIATNEIQRADKELVNRPFLVIPQKYQSLRRANSYLYSASLFPNNYDLIFQIWESLMPFFLFLDDLADLKEDLLNKTENCLLDSPDIQDNFFVLHPLMAELLKRIEPINSKLYKELDRMRKEAIVGTMGEILLYRDF
jgi:hypothetical protein